MDSSGPPVAMTIAGSDSGAGAGIQADLKTFAALDVFATTVVTAVTAQSTTGVSGVEVIEPGFVSLQLDAVLADMAVSAVKTGMLATSATVGVVAERAARGELPNLVVDPVLVSSSGHVLLDPDGVTAYIDFLLPHAVVATPNLGEAALLLGEDRREISDVAAMVTMAKRLAAFGPHCVVIKGGHLGGDDSPDVVVAGATVTVLDARRVPTGNDHGTGCSLSAAIAAGLAKGLEPLAAIIEAKAYVTQAIAGAASWHLGSGHGPIDHFGWGAGRPGRATGGRGHRTRP